MVSVLQTLLICLTAAFIAFIILLALPQSRLRSILLETFGWGAAAVSGVSIVSPIDPIPDFIPVLGQLDDLGMLVMGAVAVCFAIAQHIKRAEWSAPRPIKPVN